MHSSEGSDVTQADTIPALLKKQIAQFERSPLWSSVEDPGAQITEEVSFAQFGKHVNATCNVLKPRVCPCVGTIALPKLLRVFDSLYG